MRRKIGIDDSTISPPPPGGPARASASTLETSVGTGVGFSLRDSAGYIFLWYEQRHRRNPSSSPLFPVCSRLLSSWNISPFSVLSYIRTSRRSYPHIRTHRHTAVLSAHPSSFFLRHLCLLRLYISNSKVFDVTALCIAT